MGRKLQGQTPNSPEDAACKVQPMRAAQTRFKETSKKQSGASSAAGALSVASRETVFGSDCVLAISLRQPLETCRRRYQNFGADH